MVYKWSRGDDRLIWCIRIITTIWYVKQYECVDNGFIDEIIIVTIWYLNFDIIKKANCLICVVYYSYNVVYKWGGENEKFCC